MKKILPFCITFALTALVVSAAQTKYVGQFVGDASGLTNAVRTNSPLAMAGGATLDINGTVHSANGQVGNVAGFGVGQMLLTTDSNSYSIYGTFDSALIPTIYDWTGSGYGPLQLVGSPLNLNPHGNNVGINTLTPGYQLDVNGSINATSFLQNGLPFSGGGGVTNNQVLPGTPVITNLSGLSGTLPISTLPGNVVTNASDAQMAAQEIANAGQLRSLSDFSSFCSGEMTNTWRGQRVYQSGQAGCQQLSGRGATFLNYGTLMIPCSVTPSNTIVIVWSPGFTNATENNGETVLFQLANTNNGDSEYMHYNNSQYLQGQMGWANFNMSALNVPSVSSLGAANLMSYNNPLGGFIYTWNHMRHITIISHDGAGNVTFWDNGQAGQWYTGSAASQSFAHFPTTTMNALSIGGAYVTNGIAGMQTNGYWGAVESVFLFNGPANTNLVQSAIYASDWVQPLAIKDWWIGDSLCGQSGFFTNTMADSCERWMRNALFYDFAVGGTQISQYSIVTNWMNLQQPHGKVQTHRIFVAGGINDIYSAGRTGAQCFNQLTNAFAPLLLSDPRYELDVFGVYQTWTNAQAANYPQTAAGLQAIQIYNQCLATNRNIVKHFYDRYAFAPQSLLATNTTPRYSLLGLHFDETNGLAAYQSVNLGSFICEQTGQNPFVTTSNDQFYIDMGGRMVGVGTNGQQVYGPAGNVESTIGPSGISGTFSGNGAGLTNLSTSAITNAWPTNTVAVPASAGTNALSLVGNNINYFQMLLKNTATAGSSDFVLEEDTGTPTQNYADLFQNNSTFSSIGFDSAHDGGNILNNTNFGATWWIENTATNGRVILFTTGTNAAGARTAITNAAFYPQIAGVLASNVFSGQTFASNNSPASAASPNSFLGSNAVATVAQQTANAVALAMTNGGALTLAGTITGGTITSSGNVNVGSILGGLGLDFVSNGGGTFGMFIKDSGFASLCGYQSPSGSVVTNAGAWVGVVIMGTTNAVGPQWNGLVNMLYMTNLTTVYWVSNGPTRIGPPDIYASYWGAQTNRVDIKK